MIARVLLAVLLCGIAAGFAMGVIQHVRLTPIIQHAETFETAQAPAAHSHDANTPAEHHHDENAWAPAAGIERTLFTYGASMLTGAGFAALLAGVALVGGANITPVNGWIWGLCGFLAVSLSPAAGLPPELPGMPSADVTMRQFWWLGAVVSTSAALWLLAFKRQPLGLLAALVLLLLPHAIGAPSTSDHASTVPALLAAQFVALSLGANAVMWLIIGTLLGRFMPQHDLDTPQ